MAFHAFTGALRSAPGITGGNPPSPPTTLSTRGFTSLLFLYDGVRTSGAGTVNRNEETWNYERIDVLKGPASVLYGDTAIGGIVNFVTRRPNRNASGGEALPSYGSDGSVRAAVGLGQSLGGSAAYRIDVSHNDSKVGSIARTGEKIDHLTTGVSFGLGSSTTLELSLDYLRDDNQGYFGTPLVPAGFATQPTGVVSTSGGRVIDRALARNNYNVVDDDNSSQTCVVRARLTHKLTEGWTLRNEFVANQARRTFLNSESAVFLAPNLITRDQTLITHDQHYLFDRLDASHRGVLAGHENRLAVGGEFGKTDFDSARRFSMVGGSRRAVCRRQPNGADVHRYGQPDPDQRVHDRGCRHQLPAGSRASDAAGSQPDRQAVCKLWRPRDQPGSDRASTNPRARSQIQFLRVRTPSCATQPRLSPLSWLSLSHCSRRTGRRASVRGGPP